MGLEMSDLEYIKAEFINPVIQKLDALEKTIKNYYENSINIKNEMLDLKRCFDSFKEIHKSEHDNIWNTIRSHTAGKGKSVDLWLGVAWKVILIAGVVISVIIAFYKSGVIK